MPETTPMDRRTLIRTTLIAIGAMVGGCIVAVGTLTLVAVTVVGHAVEAKDATDGGSSAATGPASSPGSPKTVTGNAASTHRK